MQQGDRSSRALRPVALVLADIGGYTRFIRLHALSVVHAQEIVTELLEAVIDRAEHPLRLNKLEGDAAFLSAELQAGRRRCAVCSPRCAHSAKPSPLAGPSWPNTGMVADPATPAASWTAST